MKMEPNSSACLSHGQPEPDTEQRPPIIMQQMSHQLDIWTSSEDWAGVTSTDERRRLQNRLNQRAYRRRKLLLKSTTTTVVSHKATSKVTGSLRGPPTTMQPQPQQQQQHHQQQQQQQKQQKLDEVATKLNIIQQLSEQAYARYLAHDLRPENLVRLVQVNIFHALQGNADVLRLSTSWLLCDSISPFGQYGPSPATIKTHPHTCPENLRPTALQLSVSHHPWIDLLPWPELRNNLLLLTRDELIDEDDLCHDVVEFDSSVSCSDMAGFIIWGEPWDPRGWEASAAFLRKWAWTLHGCTSILEATNHWREKRGERKLKLPTQ
ncbi:hypothetical protein F4810DRAFT_202797 [Camillea tinctor]|nr:hypothetical protein F4810DRAFT_202797 [Camillea tinctor]